MWRGRAAGGRPPGRARGLLTPTASLKQEDLGAAPQRPAVAQLLHKHLQLPLLPVSPQELPLRPPVGHEGHKGTGPLWASSRFRNWAISSWKVWEWGMRLGLGQCHGLPSTWCPLPGWFL